MGPIDLSISQIFRNHYLPLEKSRNSIIYFFSLISFFLIYTLSFLSCKNDPTPVPSPDNTVTIYSNIIASLHDRVFEGKSVKLVPLMDRPVSNRNGRTDFRDCYHIFPAAIVLSMVVDNKDFDIARDIAEFYLTLFENRKSHTELLDNYGRFNGFPEVYKDMNGHVALNGEIKNDPELKYRGTGPTAWLGKSMLNYFEALFERGVEDQQMERIFNLCEAIGEWLVRLQVNNLYTPWLNGGISGALFENTTNIALGPYTEGGSAAYSFFRHLAFLENKKNRVTQAQIFKEAADRLGVWFRWVIDGKNIRIYVGRTNDGKLIEGVPSQIAEAVDTYAFAIMSGVVDNQLALQLIDRVKVSGAYITMTDSLNRILSGLKFGPQGDTIYWGPHGQITTAAFLINHSWKTNFLRDMNNAVKNEMLTVFVRPQGYNDHDRVLDWTGQPGDESWVGDLFSLEPSAWLAMLKKEYFNILGPIRWDPIIKLGDSMLEISDIELTPDDNSSPTIPFAYRYFVLDEDKDELNFTEGTKHNERSTLQINIHSIANKAVVVFQYLYGTIFPQTGYSFYIKSITGIKRFEIELKDNIGTPYFYHVDNLSEGIWYKLSLKRYPTLNSSNIREILFHFRDNGMILIDGIMQF